MPLTVRYLSFLFIILCGYNAIARQRYEQYCNGRFGYCLEYPAFLTPQPEAQNGDGRLFTDKAGQERLRVYGAGNWTFNDEGRAITLPQLYRMELQGGRFPSKPARVVKYSVLKKDWFVLSGTIGGKIFYLKVLTKGDAFCYAVLRYPESDSVIYNTVSAKLAGGFR